MEQHKRYRLGDIDDYVWLGEDGELPDAQSDHILASSMAKAELLRRILRPIVESHQDRNAGTTEDRIDKAVSALLAVKRQAGAKPKREPLLVEVAREYFKSHMQLSPPRSLRRIILDAAKIQHELPRKEQEEDFVRSVSRAFKKQRDELLVLVSRQNEPEPSSKLSRIEVIHRELRSLGLVEVSSDKTD